MQFKKLVAAGTLAALMIGSSVSFAALSDFPRPFVTSDGVQSFVVVGAAAAPSDVVGAVDIAARLGGSVTTDVTVAGGAAGFSISGEGREVATTNTKLYLDDSLGKSGVRSTMTKDDLPKLLKTGTLDDSDGGTTHNYQQFIYLTPSSTSSANYKIQFEKPGSSSSVDPTYDMGRFPTSPTDSDYLYRTYITFDKDVNMSTAQGERLEVFGRSYTIHSDTSANPAAGGSSNDKLVLSGGASDSAILHGGETLQVTVGGVAYDVTYVASSSTTVGIVKVGNDQNSITQGTSKKVGGLDVFLERVFDVSSTDPSQDSAKLQFGSQKIALQTGSKVKLGDSADSVDGTLVNLTISGGKLSAFTVYAGGRNSNEDFIKAAGGLYVDPVWKSFGINFVSATPGLTDATARDTIKISPSGDNLIQVSYADDRGYEKTVNWAYKAASTDTVFNLADNSNNTIIVVEGQTVPKDAYLVTRAGEFSHLFRVSSLSADGSSSASAELVDQFSGGTVKVNLGSGNDNNQVIDGQTFYINANSTHLTNVTWGQNANYNNTGTYVTVWPTIKGKRGEKLALFGPNATVTGLALGKIIDLPTGAINLSAWEGNVSDTVFNFTAVPKEDGTASALVGTTVSLNMSSVSNSALLTLGRTTTGGLIYNITTPGGTNNGSLTISVVGGSGSARLSAPGLVLAEEKDSNSDQYSVVFSASTESSGSNNVAIPNLVGHTFSSSGSGVGGVSRGSDSTITDYVDLYGTYTVKTTTGQDTLTVYYPDDQVNNNVFVLAKEATVTQTSGGAGTTVKSATAVKTALGKLDTEVTSADKSTKHLILVGGPAVNTLVAELATAGKTRDTAWYRSQGAGTALVDLVENAFASGRSALVVAGHSAADTRSATGRIQNYDAYSWAGMRVVLKNGVVTTEAA